MLKRLALLSTCLLVSLCARAKDSNLSGKEFKESRPVPPVPAVKDVPIDGKLQAAAKTEMTVASVSENPVVRALEMELGPQLLGAGMKDDIIKALSDDDARVRLNAAMAVGDLKLKAAKAEVTKMVDDSDPVVRVSVRYALHRLGDFHLSHELEQLSLDPNPDVRASTAVVLGKIGAPSAAKILFPMQKDVEPAVRLRVAEAQWRLGQERGLQQLVAATISAYPDDAIVALGAIGSSKNEKLQLHVVAALTADYPEVSLAAARAMGELGSDAGYGVALEGAKSKEPRHRYMAALALGAIHRVDAQDTLAILLKDETAVIRLAAAHAILQLAAK